MYRDETIDELDTDPRDAASRLGEAIKQIQLAEERLDDDELTDDLREAAAAVDEVRSEVSFTDDD